MSWTMSLAGDRNQCQLPGQCACAFSFSGSGDMFVTIAVSPSDEAPAEVALGLSVKSCCCCHLPLGELGRMRDEGASKVGKVPSTPCRSSCWMVLAAKAARLGTLVSYTCAPSPTGASTLPQTQTAPASSNQALKSPMLRKEHAAKTARTPPRSCEAFCQRAIIWVPGWLPGRKFVGSFTHRPGLPWPLISSCHVLVLETI